MNSEQILEHLIKHNVKPTANRILIAEAISRYNGPVSMKELETKLQTIDKSSIFRTLIVFSNQHVVHQVEDGNDIVRYELCMSDDEETDSDMHAHFYCEQCQHTTCLHEVDIPEIHLPEGYKLSNVNFMLKGICPECSAKQKR
ncbi:Fur family transcriptional regulator [Prevotella aurantiaca]|uniref:Fur family transcriptional regulator n=1 Tax=Prevotella aurantiaca TaxID=596085 RepID=UPI0028DC19EB|nr:transcriptional repressor [Prevotella aurantiaca]